MRTRSEGHRHARGPPLGESALDDLEGDRPLAPRPRHEADRIPLPRGRGWHGPEGPSPPDPGSSRARLQRAVGRPMPDWEQYEARAGLEQPPARDALQVRP